jgi:hypothetical protein
MVSQAPAAAVADGVQPDGQLVPHSSSQLSIGGARVVLGPQHALRIRVLAALLCAAVDAAEWQLARQAAVQLTPLYCLVYPQVRLYVYLLVSLSTCLHFPASLLDATSTGFPLQLLHLV